MWNKNAVCFVYFFSLHVVIFCDNIGVDLDSIMMSPRDVSNDTVLDILRRGYEAIETSHEKERSDLFLRAEKKRFVIDHSKGENTMHLTSEEYGGKRVKRQVGKFVDAAKFDNLKMFRIYLTLFKNLWSESYVGGAHPLHKDVPKPVILLFQQRIMDFFFPPIGETLEMRN